MIQRKNFSKQICQNYFISENQRNSSLYNTVGGTIPNLSAFRTKCLTIFQPTAIFFFFDQICGKFMGNFSTMFRKTSANLVWYSYAGSTLECCLLCCYFSKLFNLSYCFSLQAVISSFIYWHRFCKFAIQSKSFALVYCLAACSYCSIDWLCLEARNSESLVFYRYFLLSQDSKKKILYFSVMFYCQTNAFLSLSSSVLSFCYSSCILFCILNSSSRKQ